MSTATRPASAQRFAARARHRRIRGLVRLLLVLLLLVAAGGVVWLVGWSSVLSVQHMTVAGVDDEVRDGVAEELRSDVAESAEVPIGMPLMRVDTGQVADRVRELPAVGDVEIRRSWPNTLTIEVEPREAAAAIRDGGTWWSVDHTGTLFNRSEAAPEGVPVLGAPVEESATLARSTGVAVLTGLPSSIEDMVERVEAESAADVRLTLDSGVTVVWGQAERAEEKARVLLELMDRQDEQPSAYDVSAPDTPAVVP